MTDVRCLVGAHALYRLVEGGRRFDACTRCLYRRRRWPDHLEPSRRSGVEFLHNIGIHRFCIRTYVTAPSMWVPEGVDIDLTFGPTQEVHS